jgi:triosephosphate isomerase
MRRKFVAGNWKMNGSLSSAEALLEGLVPAVSELNRADIAVCSPSVYLPLVAQRLAASNIRWGAQNLSEQDAGAYTGEISAGMLVDFGCDYVIVGHSERRALFGESSDLVAAKTEQALAKGLIPIVCIGETLEQREADQTLEVVAEQLAPVLALGEQAVLSVVLAYEPVWAIGTGKTASPDQAQQVHAFIRGLLKQVSVAAAEKVQVLYGGSVGAANAAELFAQPDIDGGLVGGASLKVDDFAAIISAAQNA